MGRIALDVTGVRFGRLIARTPMTSRLRKRVVWQCDCDCGAKPTALLAKLMSGKTKSCGCLRREMGRQRGLKNRKPPVEGKTKMKPVYKMFVCLGPCRKLWLTHAGKRICPACEAKRPPYAGTIRVIPDPTRRM